MVIQIYHPNINYEGAVCVNILRPWKSIYTIQMVLLALLFLFADPNPMDVLEKGGSTTSAQRPAPNAQRPARRYPLHRFPHPALY